MLIEVKDNRLGIKEEDKTKVFTMFKMHKHVEGIGIVLSYRKKIVDNSRGNIETESELGKGPTFKIKLKIL